MSLETKTSRRVVGLMSGTSLDGIDAAVVDLSGSGPDVSIELVSFLSRPYAADLKALLLKNSAPDTSSVSEISQLNVRLASEYARLIHDLIDQAGLSISDIDAVGSHGQTVYHVPDPEMCAGEPTRSTLQLGDPSTLANLLGIPVVGDFRLADMAVGGHGAPLASYFDYVYFGSADEHRGLLNIGGIANISVVPKACAPDDVFAFDTGPGNMVIDALVQHFWGEPYDRGGAYARAGTVNKSLLDALLDDDYYAAPPPKTTGRELYDAVYVNRVLDLVKRFSITSPEEVIATATALTVETIVDACNTLVLPRVKLDRVIASGGGVHNSTIMEGLKDRLAPVDVVSADELGLNADAKEAMFFALFAHETLNRMPSNIPTATGASRPAILGKICLP